MPPALTTVSYNANNQQTTFGSNTITYDGSVTTTYTWNVRNQLTGISNTGFSTREDWGQVLQSHIVTG